MARRAYEKFVEAGIHTPPENPMEKLSAQMILGGEDFVEEIKNRLKTQNISGEDISEGKDILKWSMKEARETLENIAVFYHVSIETLKEKKCRDNWPRDVAIWVFSKQSKWSGKKIGVKFGISGSAVGKAVRRVESAADSSTISKELKAIHSRFPA